MDSGPLDERAKVMITTNGVIEMVGVLMRLHTCFTASVCAV